MRHVLFAAAGGPGVGLGHLMRCSVLAGELSARAWTVRAMSRCASAAVFWTDQGLSPSQIVVGPDVDLARLAAALRPAVLVADDYGLDEVMLARVKSALPGGLLVQFHDAPGGIARGDIVWNPTANATSFSYETPPTTRLLLGPQFALIRGARGGVRSCRTRVERVLIATGGASLEPFGPIAVDAVRECLPDAWIDVLIGPYSSPPGAALLTTPRVQCHQNVRDPYPLMCDCDLAVTAAGQTVFELALTGTPAVAVTVAENQRHNAEGFARLGTLAYCGSAGDPDLPHALRACVLRLARDPQARKAMSDAGRELVDGQGAVRVADAIEASVPGGWA